MNKVYIAEKTEKNRSLNSAANQVRTAQSKTGYTAGMGEDKSKAATNKQGENITLEISEEGRRKQQEALQMQMYARQMKTEKDNAEKKGNELGKIMTIFRRIANGDIVPWKDEKKLMEHSLEMYQAAKNIASMKENDDPEKHKSVDEDEKKKNGQAIDAETAVAELVDSAENPVENSGGEVNFSGEMSDII